jgi:predicted ATPase/DNA-binding CsgD family transcriptional regulator/DNA-binding XRE family transcriptional regulator
MTGATAGARIRALRQRLGLSQVELAAMLDVSNVTVNRWENDKALPQPAALERLARLERDGPEGLRASPGDARGNLPRSYAPLVGRAVELATVTAALAAHPLVTITGAAGTGKTRLAVEAGRSVAGTFPDGVWFTDLAAVSDAADVAHAVAGTLGVRESGRKPLGERLADELRQRTLLLVLDNCEHLRPACADLVERLLDPDGPSRLLATSRVPLDVATETVFPLRPLAPADAADLFLQRARERQPGLTPDPGQAQVIAEICRRLDGLPLAIELAAARTSILSIEQIAGRLDRRFELLRAAGTEAMRQQALDTAIAWSYDLLAPEEARLFRTLGVFAGWFDLAAVEGVTERVDALDRLASLARQSMIVVEFDAASQAARYRLLESLAAFAREVLERAGEAANAGDRHAAYYGTLAQELARGLRGSGQASLLARLDRERDNLVAALEWELACGDAAAAIALAAALGPYWRLRGHYAEGSTWLERALAHDAARAAPARLEALNQLGLLSYHSSRLDEALRVLQTAIDLAREFGDRDQEARALDTLGLVLVARRELPPAAVAHEAALALFLELGDRARAAMSRLHLGNMANLRGDHKTAERAYHEAWSLVQGTGDAAAEAQILSNLGEIAARTGRYSRALGYYERALTRYRAIGDPARIAAVATNTAEVQLVLGNAEAAVPLASDAVARFRQIGNPAFLADAIYVEAAALAAVGRGSAALTLFREMLALEQQHRDWIDSVYAIEAIAHLFADGGDPALAARLLGGAEVLREAHQVADYPLFDMVGTLASIRAELGGEAMAACWAEGRAFSPAEVVAEAMFVGEVDDGAPIQILVVRSQPQAFAYRDGALTDRQIDVLRLVAAGRSNREIGAALAISDRTVERHLTAIYGALDVDRRSAAVARAIALGLIQEPAL